MMAPKGDQALALIGNDVYVSHRPADRRRRADGDGRRKPDSAAMPVRKLTDIGGEFPAWGADGRTMHWSIGNAFVTYRLDRAEAVDDSLRRAGADSAARARLPYRAEEQRFAHCRRTATFRRAPWCCAAPGSMTMKGQRVVENADVVIRDNRIVSVGRARRGARRRAGHRRSGKTIVPGFVDTHSHMWPLWGLHWPQPWMYLANAGLRRHDDA